MKREKSGSPPESPADSPEPQPQLVKKNDVPDVPDLPVPPEPVDNTDHFEKLPDELILKIFEYLPPRELRKCTLVSRRWFQVSSDERFNLWSRLYIQHETVPFTRLANVLQRGVLTLQLLSVTILDDFGPDDKPFPDNYETKLQELVVLRPIISEPSISLLLEHSKQLIKLDISRCAVSQRICNAIGAISGLELLLLNGCSGFNEENIAAVFSGCRRLREVGLCSTKLTSETIDAMIVHLTPTIMQFDIRLCGPDTLFDSHIMGIVRACPHLTYLDIAGNTGLTEEAHNLIHNTIQ